MTKNMYHVYWESRTADGKMRKYSRIFKHEIQAVPFFAEKKLNPSTTFAFVHEMAVDFNDRGRAYDIRVTAILGTYDAQ